MKLSEKVIREISSSQEVGLRSILDPKRGARFQTKLENYISTEKKGLPDMGSGVPLALAEKLSASSSFLAKNDPKLLKQYSAYVSSLQWDQRSRFVSNVDDSLNQTQKIIEGAKELEESRKS